MQVRGIPSYSQSEEQPLFFLNPEPNSLAAVIKSAATELTRAKTQARISQQPKSIFIKNDYKDAQILFLYDFYKESDIENFKIFIEGLYGAIEQIILSLQQTKIPFAKNLPIKTENKDSNLEDRAKGQISLPVETVSTFDASSTQLQEIEMNILLAIKSLIEVNQNFKKYFTDQKTLIDETEFDMSERVKFSDDNKAGRRVVLSIHPVFETLEMSLKLLQDLLQAQKASQETHHTQINRRNKTEEAHALRGDAEISIYTSVETFAQKQGLSPREPIPETATKSINTELNAAGLENDTKSISDLLKKIVGHLGKRDQINTEFSHEGGFFMDKKTFRLLTEIEREMKMESWLLRTLEANSRKDSVHFSNKRDQELEELKMRNSLISDDLQYKTQLLSVKLHEVSELAVETERLRDDNSRLLQFINLQKEHTHGKARWAYEREIGAKEDLEKARLRANSLEKQIDDLKSEIKQREEALTQLNEQNQAIRESKEQQKDQLRLQLQALEKHLKDGQSTRDDLQRKNAKLESELDTLVRENSRLTTEARELRNELKSIYDLKIHMDKVSHQKEAPKERSQAANATEPDYKLRYEQLMIDYDRLKKILDQHKSVDHFHDKEKEQLAAKVEALSNENKALKKEINTSIVSYEKQLREVRVENEDLQSKLSELRSKSQNLRRAHIGLEDELRKSHSDVINLSNDQIDLAERFKKARFSPQRSPPTKSSVNVYRTPERRNHISPDSRYENSQSRSGSPAYEKYAKISDNLNSRMPSKALRPLNQNVSFTLISPKNISELGIRKPSQKEREWPAKDLKSSKSDQKFSLIERIKPLPPGKSQLKDQSLNFYNDGQNELEDELKLFYSVSKIIDDSLSEQNSFARGPYRKRESPEKTRMISKTLTEVNSKLEDLKDNLPARKVWRAINEIEEQCDDLSVDDIRSRSFIEEPRREIQKRKMNLPTRKSKEDAYSIITMQSNLIKKLLKNIK